MAKRIKIRKKQNETGQQTNNNLNGYSIDKEGSQLALLILTFTRCSPDDVKFVFQFFIDFLINSTIFSGAGPDAVQGYWLKIF